MNGSIPSFWLTRSPAPWSCPRRVVQNPSFRSILCFLYKRVCLLGSRRTKEKRGMECTTAGGGDGSKRQKSNSELGGHTNQKTRVEYDFIPRNTGT